MIKLGRWRLLAANSMAAVLVTVAGHSLKAQGTISGRVTSEANAPLADVRILLIGSSQSAMTGEDGKYTLRNVAPGNAELQALRVGYRALKKTVNVASGLSVVADFQMAAAIVQLDEVVTTATGQQRKVELGNAISTLGDVGKHVEQSEVTSFSDLLVAKSPGVIVLPSPVVGGAPTIRVRGISSINLSNAPIYVVDGVRYLSNNTSSSGANSLSLLNNLSPEEIEDIEIVKGPSAATLYGTNAANGVIVITTKKGRSGNTKWNFTGETRTIDDRNPYQAQYANFGHLASSPGKEIRCQLYVTQTTAFTAANGATCISDSLTSYNQLEDNTNTFIHLGRGSLTGVSVNGGNDAVRYFASGNLDNEFGPIQMPAQDIRFFDDSLHVPVTNTMLHPRQQQRLNFRTNLSAALSPKVDLSVNAGFGKSSNFIEVDNSSIIGLLYVGQASFGWKGCPKGTETTGCGMTGADGKPYVDGTGFPLHDNNGFAPGSIMQYTTSDDVQRFTGSIDGNWRPLAWMQNQGTVGVDLSDNDQFHICKLNECPNQGATSRVGNVFDFKENRRNFSAKIASTASWQARTWANLKTSIGSEYTNVENDNENAQGRTLAPGAASLGATSTFVGFSALQPTAVKTLGYYAQEQASLRDRLFLTVAARSDQNSAFGTKFQKVVYPKVSLSWIMSDESFFPQFGWMNSFRLRSAYGANGVQPQATAALQTFSAATQTVTKVDATTGTDLPGLTANNPGNSNLRPETSAELESGFETDMLNRRLHLDYTFYKKNTKDALIALPIPSSVGSPVTSLQQNIGKTQNWGHEIQANAVLVDRRSFSWDVTLSGSHNSNKWVDLGKDPSKASCLTLPNALPSCNDLIIGAGTVTQQRKGDPLFSQWYRNYTFSDDNHDGVIQQSEVHVDSLLTRAGVGFAKDIASVQTGFDLFQRRMRINALFDYKGGGSTLEGNYFQCNSSPKACRETQDPTAPLWMQARAVATNYGTKLNGTTYTSRKGYFVQQQFWKFREFSSSVNLPSRVTRALAAQNGSTLVFSLRNIHTWSSFTGVDPEQNYGVTGQELSQDFNTSPPPTYITFRLNLKY